jgi:uroporphyrinogen-III synthase
LPGAAGRIFSRAEALRILLTRPEPDASETAARLKAGGHEVIVAPLLTIVLAPPPSDLPDPKAIILTSRNGVRALATWPQASGWRDLPVFVTGVATARTAREAGFVNVMTAASDAADLAGHFMAHIDKDVRPILYPAARDRTGALTEGLRANGYDVRAVEAYSAEMARTLGAAAMDAVRRNAVEGVLLYSNRTAAAFRAIVDRYDLAEHLRMTVLYALSDRVAEPLRGLPGWLRVAPHPDEESLLDLLPKGRR